MKFVKADSEYLSSPTDDLSLDDAPDFTSASWIKTPLKEYLLAYRWTCGCFAYGDIITACDTEWCERDPAITVRP